MPSAANLLHEKKGLGKAVEPPLRVREDWWVFERLLRFKGGLLVFRRFKKLLLLFRSSREDWWVFEKTLNAKEVFRKPYSRLIYKKIKHIF